MIFDFFYIGLEKILNNFLVKGRIKVRMGSQLGKKVFHYTVSYLKLVIKFSY